jgi:tyrosyl-tRNA synthetase
MVAPGMMSKLVKKNFLPYLKNSAIHVVSGDMEIEDSSIFCEMEFKNNSITLDQIIILSMLSKMDLDPIILLNRDNPVEEVVNKIIPNVLILYPEDWLSHLSYIHFLRDIGSQFDVRELVDLEEIKGNHVSFDEFNKPLIAAYNFLHLLENHNCKVQIGSRTSWEKINRGIDLIKRVRNESALGIKIETVEEVNIPLDPYEIYNYFISIPDSKIPEYYAALKPGISEDPDPTIARTWLALSITELMFGKERALEAEKKYKDIYTGNINLEDIPTIGISRINSGMSLTDMIHEGGIRASRNESRKLITAGGVSVNKEKITNPEFILTKKEFIEGCITIKVGKKNIYRWRLS